MKFGDSLKLGARLFTPVKYFPDPITGELGIMALARHHKSPRCYWLWGSEIKALRGHGYRVQAWALID